ncbi:MAG TPA: DUF1570 domain-containing protein [Lacipirellulaceae bacterium]|nr:DUF1570 domain-containing protein [Lacipirellulaceae bacterium]
MRRSQLVILILLCLLAGCRGLPQMPLSPLPSAHEVPVGELVFHSDFDLPADHRLVRELVEEREYVSTTLGLPTSTEPIEVYLFRDQDHYREYLMRNFPSVPSRRAFFLETDTKLRVYAHWSDRVGEDLRHEVSHGYLHAAIPNLPLWVDEGLAEYFEVPRGYAGLNQPHVELLSDSIERDNWKPDLKRLESLTDSAQMGQREYAESWAWVYFMLNSPPERRAILTGYLADLRTKGAAEPISARLDGLSAEPEGPLTNYIATLKKNSTVR